jgi:hypothetical protein
MPQKETLKSSRFVLIKDIEQKSTDGHLIFDEDDKDHTFDQKVINDRQ